jgi:hypothetical protein
MLAQIPLTDDERAAAESDRDAVERLLGRLIDTPTPTGRTPRQLGATSPGDSKATTEQRQAR